MAFPPGPQFTGAAAVTLVRKAGGDDAIRPDVPELPPQFAPGGHEAHGLGIADDRRPDRALALMQMFVAIADPCLVPAADS